MNTEDIDIKNMKTQLEIINRQRNVLIEKIRERYCQIVKNADDALMYVGEYIKLTIWFSYWQIEDATCYFCDAEVHDDYDSIEIKRLFNELCEPYITMISGYKGDSGDYLIKFEYKK